MHKIPTKTLVDPRDASREELDLIMDKALALHLKYMDYAAERLFNEARSMEEALVAQHLA